MHRKVLEYHDIVDCHAAVFLYEDIIHTRVPLVSRAMSVNAENAHMESVFGKKTYIVDIANPSMTFVYSSEERDPSNGREAYFSNGQNPMDRRVEIMDAFRYNLSVSIWKFRLPLPLVRERSIHVSKIGKGVHVISVYEITLEACSKHDLARMERLLYNTLDENAVVVHNG